MSMMRYSPYSHHSMMPMEPFFDDWFNRSFRSMMPHHDTRMHDTRMPSSMMTPFSSHDIISPSWHVPAWRDDGHHNMSLEINLKGFKPEEIKLETRNHAIIVEAHHEDKTEHGFKKRHFVETISLPKGMNLDTMHSNLGVNGMLTITGKASLPIEHKPHNPVSITHNK